METLENKFRLIDLINFDKVNILLENFNKATGFVTAILDVEGNVLSKSGWRQICTDFHRFNTETAKRCTQSDLMLTGKLAEGQNYHCHNCLNGLVDAAVPIIINNEFVGNLFTGQFFLEKPDREFFQKQALKYGFEEKAYLDALDEVPIVSENQVNQVMNFLLSMTELISEMTQQSFEQKMLNESLIVSEGKYRGLYNSIRDSIIVADINRNIIDCNPAFCSLFGYSKEEILGKQTVYVYESETEFKELGEALKAHYGEKPFLKTVKYKKKSGLIFPGETNVFYLKNDLGEVSGFIGLIRDISERKQTEKDLQASEEKFKSIFNHSPLGKSITNLDGTMEINRAFSEMLGYSIIELKAKNWKEITHPEDIQKSADFVQSLIDGKVTKAQYEKRYLHKNGDIVWTEIITALIRDEENNPKYFQTTINDISERKQAEKKLKDSEDRLKEAQNVAKLGHYAFDIKSGYWEASEELNTIFGIDENYTKDVNGWLGIIHPDFQEIMKNYLENQIFKLHQKFDIEYKIICVQTGEEKWVHGLGNLKFDEKNNLVKMFGVIQDITDRKLAEKEIKNKEKQFRTIVESAGESMFLADYETKKIILANQHACHTLGYSHDELLSLKVNELDPTYLSDEELENFWNSLTIDVPITIETMHKRKDGSIFPIEVRTGLIMYNEKKTILGFARDITERMQVEGKVRASEERYRALLQNLEAGIVVHAPDTSIAMNNPIASRLLGLNDDQMKGKEAIDPAWKFVTEDNTPMALEDYPVNQIANGKKPIKDQILGIYQPDKNEIVWVNVNGFPALNSKDEITEIVISFIDITERKRVEEELKKHREHLEELIKERTQEVDEKNKKLSDQMKIFVGREMKIRDLEAKIKVLQGK